MFRRSLLVGGCLCVTFAVASCGGDDDDADASATIVIGTGEPVGTSDGDGAGDEETSRDVGRASFTHTIVAGDFLRSIADTYDIEIDDIVAANGWEDGRDHLLLPGQEIYLPADAKQPPDATEAPDGGDGGQPAGGPVATVDPANAGNGYDYYFECPDGSEGRGEQIRQGDTQTAIAQRMGLSFGEIEAANEDNSSWNRLPVDAFVFYPCGLPPPCPDGSARPYDDVASPETESSFAAEHGLTIDQLAAANTEHANFLIVGDDTLNKPFNVDYVWLPCPGGVND